MNVSASLAPDVLSACCPSREVLRHLTSRWGFLVVLVLRDGTLRFSELRRRIDGVSERMLAETLRALESDGIVARRALPVVPPHVEYALTPLGREASERMGALVEWVHGNLGRMRPAG